MVNKFADKDKKIKKEFDDFASKIAQLESLRHELDSLDTKGFEIEAKVIRSNLKDVNAIPRIRRELNSLKDKIAHHHARKSIRNNVTKELLVKSKSLESDQDKIKRKIAELTKQLKDKRKVACKRQLSTRDVDFVKDIPNVESQLKALREDFNAHTHSAKIKVDSGVGVLVDSKFDDFIGEIKGELTNRIKSRELAMQAQLNVDLQEHEKKFAERYQDLVKEFHQKYKERVNHELKKEISENFNNKLKDAIAKEKKSIVDKLIYQNAKRLALEKKKIVDELSSEYAAKENMLHGQIKSERQHLKQSFLKNILGLKHKEEILADKIRNEEEELKDSYSKKKSELQKKIDNLQIQTKTLESKNKEIEFRLVDKKKQLDSELLRLKAEEKRAVEENNKKAEEIIKKKKQALNEEFKRKVAEERRKAQHEAIAKLAVERKQLDSELLRLKAEEKRAVEENNKKAEEIIKKKKQALNEEFKRKVAEERRKAHEEAISQINKAKKDSADEIERQLIIREAEIRKSLEAEYKSKLQKEIAVRNAQIEKKKEELEQHILSQARKMFH